MPWVGSSIPLWGMVGMALVFLLQLDMKTDFKGKRDTTLFKSTQKIDPNLLQCVAASPIAEICNICVKSQTNAYTSC